jgi:hypothetical protein
MEEGVGVSDQKGPHYDQRIRLSVKKHELRRLANKTIGDIKEFDKRIFEIKKKALEQLSRLQSEASILKQQLSKK